MIDLFPFFLTALKDGAFGPLFERLIFFFAAWFLVRKEVRSQFKLITESINKVAVTLERVETAHSLRIEALESKVKNIEKESQNG